MHNKLLDRCNYQFKKDITIGKWTEKNVPPFDTTLSSTQSSMTVKLPLYHSITLIRRGREDSNLIILINKSSQNTHISQQQLLITTCWL